MTTYTIVTAAGLELTGLRLNGTMFVSDTEVQKEDLDADALSEVTVITIPENGDPVEETKENQVCDAVLHWDEGWLFNLRDMTQQEKDIAQLDARIAFLEMMGGYEE